MGKHRGEKYTGCITTFMALPILIPLALYRKWSAGKDRCKCGHPSGLSCSARALREVHLRGVLALPLVAALALGPCDSDKGDRGWHR